MDWHLSLTGLFWGAMSAVSLPLGALIGLRLQPSTKVTSALMAFGGGALLFALTIELFGHALHVASDAHGAIVRPGILLATMIAAVVGGLLFQGLNQALEHQGAFFRRNALIKQHVGKEKRRQAKKLLKSLSQVKLLQALPAEEVIKLIPYVKSAKIGPRETIFQEGEVGDKLYFIVSGKVQIARAAEKIATLQAGDVFGEMSLISQNPRTATATAETKVKVWEIFRSDFDYALFEAPKLQAAVERLAQERIQDLSHKEAVSKEEANDWEQQALRNLGRVEVEATEHDIREEVEQHGGKGGAASAIWLGIALDGIPESLVIGMLVVKAAADQTAMSLAFIVGVFLANLPEAMSSAVTMQKNGLSKRKILLMWGSLCLLTGVGALLGTLIFPPHPEGGLVFVLFGIEGLAAGAMLTMIAETMLPEAFEQGGGPVVGLSTLAGFLAALAVKLIH